MGQNYDPFGEHSHCPYFSSAHNIIKGSIYSFVFGPINKLIYSKIMSLLMLQFSSKMSRLTSTLVLALFPTLKSATENGSSVEGQLEFLVFTALFQSETSSTRKLRKLPQKGQYSVYRATILDVLQSPEEEQ